MTCENCGGACCLYLFFFANLTTDEKEFYSLRGAEFYDDLVLIPLKCNALTDAGECAIYKDKPEVCAKFPSYVKGLSAAKVYKLKKALKCSL